MRLEEQQLISQLLGKLADSLDVPPELQSEAAAEYNDLGRFLKGNDKEDRKRDPDIFPQGSSSTGTVVQPITRKDDFDVDLVYVRPIQRQSTTQDQLKSEAHDRLQAYQRDLKRRGKHVPKLESKPRCLSLTYPKWHMDVVPMIPKDLDTASTTLLISDRDEREWMETDPKGYRDWFLSRSQFVKLREDFARAAGRPVQQVPVWEVKSPLQRAVQVLKRHRDWHFRTTPDQRPASIVLTTIAANNYHGQGEVADVLVAFCKGARTLEQVDGKRWVRNPTIREENFISKWQKDKQLEPEFDRWVQKLESDIAALRNSQLPDMRVPLQEMVGPDLAKAVLVNFGNETTARRENGKLYVSSTGLLGATGVSTVASHTFYGCTEIQQ